MDEAVGVVLHSLMSFRMIDHVALKRRMTLEKAQVIDESGVVTYLLGDLGMMGQVVVYIGILPAFKCGLGIVRMLQEGSRISTNIGGDFWMVIQKHRYPGLHLEKFRRGDDLRMSLD